MKVPSHGRGQMFATVEERGDADVSDDFTEGASRGVSRVCFCICMFVSVYCQ